MITLVVYLVLGVFVGILAGLLGIGGGVILVPILDFTLPFENINATVIHHMALATSMASIMFTSLSSTRSHNKRGTVRWDIVKAMAPGLLIGTLAGTFVVSGIPTKPLKIIFAVFLTYTSIQMIMDLKPKASFHLPGKIGLLLAGLAIGTVSSFVGIGGGALIIPFLVMCNVPMINVIGASAAMGFPIAIAGTAGFIINGWGNQLLPDYSLGFIYLPALIGLVAASMLCAPLGVKLSHSLPVKTLKRCFGVILFAMAARMIYSIM
ncbi:sulfite exporter TauE/SafE family protein [Desulfovibrio sp. OttesenSCG-928-O18]|nr:sulfite exporter TauE/SafE family protein [Desulfovibrio sp. OttesenSCG-928-O18]